LVVNFIKETLKVRCAQLQHHYEAVYKENLKAWTQQGATEDMPVKPTPPAVKTICDDGSAVGWCHSMAASENEGHGFVVLHECKKFMSSASNASGAFPNCGTATATPMTFRTTTKSLRWKNLCS